ncbi:hypothetical protein O181_047140 [Austropuccinia psidii MF-1]|uniref:Calcineurin-like phosphoesterase domain-containing protein n=1 Tax=Austropuccinia psidii MF-1 TaxID=1389203 RepID=A0A9Q3DUR9_9BASI|nr:hypothetical protein [Austropuccinia psidii MF-1]
MLSDNNFVFRSLIGLSLIQSILNCGDHQLHKRHQPFASQPQSSPTRHLEWGDLNIIHTTDTHGWLLGHLKSEQPEPNYSGDFGDFQSFVLRMKQKAKRKNVDLLIIDTGDLHDGNGLSDAEPLFHPGKNRGSASGKFFARIPYDILAIGNHELYQLPIAQDMHDNFAPIWRGSYLTSNVNITTSGKSLPIGSRYRKFKTAHGRKVTAFGIIFDFTGNAKGTIVQPPAKLVHEHWFQEAIRDKPDVFLLTGHMGISDADWKIVFDSIRSLHPKVPIIILGGHLHIRDCRQLDNRSMSLASGRYMETIGWMSLSGFDDPHQKFKFTRRYLDPNRVTFAFHTGTSFDTHQGIKTTHGLTKTAIEFNLTHRFGIAPHSFFIDRVPPMSNNSINYLYTGPGGVLPTLIKNPHRPHPPFTIVNTGSMRFDVFAGNFTVNDQFIAMPFDNSFQYIPDVPRQTAEKLLAEMNRGGVAISRTTQTKIRRSLESIDDLKKDEKYHLGHDIEEHYRHWLKLQFLRHQHSQLPLISGNNQEIDLNGEIVARSISQHSGALKSSYGYVTKDQCPGEGDDIAHQPLPVFDQPAYVATSLPPNANEVDVVFYNFIGKFIITALNKAESNHTRTYTIDQVQNYTEIKANEILGRYAQMKWN